MGKMRKNKLIWFGHIMKRNISEPVIVVMEMNVEGKRKTKEDIDRWNKGILRYLV